MNQNRLIPTAAIDFIEERMKKLKKWTTYDLQTEEGKKNIIEIYNEWRNEKE